MKKLSVLFAAALLVALSSVSCCKSDGGGNNNGNNNGGDNVVGNVGDPSPFDGKISGTISNVPVGAGSFTLQGFFYSHGFKSADPDVTTTVNGNGTFSMTLPTPPAGMLQSFSLQPSITVSDPAALATTIVFEASGANIPDGTPVNYVSTDLTVPSEVDFWYVDRDVTITGTESESYGVSITYNMNLKAGWNKVVGSTTNTTTATTGAYTTGNIPSSLIWTLSL